MVPTGTLGQPPPITTMSVPTSTVSCRYRPVGAADALSAPLPMAPASPAAAAPGAGAPPTSPSRPACPPGWHSSHDPISRSHRQTSEKKTWPSVPPITQTDRPSVTMVCPKRREGAGPAGSWIRQVEVASVNSEMLFELNIPKGYPVPPKTMIRPSLTATADCEHVVSGIRPRIGTCSHRSDRMWNRHISRYSVAGCSYPPYT
mmetsp:Transcript_17107/g.44546  ORF Transcript_17107/g.44546 Transcript_17107/m.44546 type:complete len:203 (+) Transcript_17107:1007-1615(+)